ncbi:MAG: glycosyltransferase [Prolixibacteraceae bacterium]
MPESIPISLIICTYNRDKFLPLCLAALTRQDCSVDDFEIILINNNSTDTTDQICHNFLEQNKKIHFNYFIETKQGLSVARNRGIAESIGKVISFIDDDAIICDNYVSNLLKHFLSSDLMAGGGKILPKWETQAPIWINKYLLPLFSLIDMGEKQKPFTGKRYPIGANMFFKKEIFDEIGLFNEELGRTGKNMMGGEEKDIFNKIKAKNHQINYFPDIWVYHIIPDERTTVSFVRKQAYGIGLSEKVRTSDSLKNRSLSIVSEGMKWGATLLIVLAHLFNLRFSSAIMLIRFRYWVTSKLL